MSDYNIYTTKHDITTTARSLLNKRLDAMCDTPGDDERWLASVDKFMKLANGGINIDGIGPGQPVTILIEMGGSMRGHNTLTAISAVEVLGDALSAEGRDFSILGYTTSQWRGGRSRKDWFDAGRPRLPGRLNDLLHITFKSFEDDWSQVRDDLKLAFIEDVLKENIDGEAFLWARQTQLETGIEGSILHISDGPSMDDSTNAVNLMGFLDKHRSKVISYLQDQDVPFRTVDVTKVTDDLSLMKVDPEASRCTAYVDMLCNAILEMEAERTLSEAPEIS